MKNYKANFAETIVDPREKTIKGQGNEIAGDVLYNSILGNMAGEIVVGTINLEMGNKQLLGLNEKQFEEIEYNSAHRPTESALRRNRDS